MDSKSVNIYLTKENRKEILEKATPHEKYVIEMNEKLQIENRKLRDELKELENDKSVFEEENENGCLWMSIRAF